jgi:RIO-like serine/threonine protein kinase
VSSQGDTAHTPLSLEDLKGHPHTVLKDEGQGAARVVRYDLPEGPVVLKEWIPKGSRLMAAWARLWMRREIRHYRSLNGTSGVPHYRGHDGDTALIIEFVEGTPIHRGLPPERLHPGLDSLDRVLEALHAARFAHLDLHQKLNALIDTSGHTWVIDLGQGLDCSRGVLRRMIFPLLARVDRIAALKFRARYAPETLPEKDRERLVKRFSRRNTPWQKSLGRKLRRKILGES